MKDNHIKEQTETFALKAMVYCLAIIGVLIVLSSIVSCSKDELDEIITPAPIVY